MPIKVSQMPAATYPISGAELTMLVQGGANVQIPVYTFFSFLNAKNLGVKGDGTTNDAAALSAAVTTAATAKMPLFIPPGTYELGSSGISYNGPGPVHILGAGRSTILRRTNDSSTEAVLIQNATDVSVENLQVYTPALTATVINSNAGIHLQGCTNAIVRNCYSAGLFYEGIIFENCTKGLASFNEVRGPQNRCLYAYLASSDIIFTNNLIDGSNFGGTTPTSDYGINVNPGGSGRLIDGILIANNAVRNTTHQGIAISENTRNWSVSGNEVTGVSGFYGILVQLANSVQGGFGNVIGNAVKNCGQYGIYVTGSFYTSIMGNTLFSNTLDGIQLNSSQNCSIIGNQCISNGGNGIQLTTGSNRNLVTGNQCVSNTARGFLIATSDCTFNRYNDNYFYNNTGGTFLDSGTSSSAGTSMTS